MSKRPERKDPLAALSSEVRAQMRETFLDEAAGVLDDLETALLALEQAPLDEETINRAFRAAHTIKGSAAGVGCVEVASFTHGLEDALDAVRSRRWALTPGALTVLLEGVDLLRDLLIAARHDGPAPDAGLGFEERLARAFAPPAENAPHAPAAPVEIDAEAALRPQAGPQMPGVGEKGPATSEQANGARAYEIRFRLPEDAFERGLDPVALLGALGQEADLINVTPLLDRLPALDALDPMGCYLGFACVASTEEDGEELRAIFEFCPPETYLVIHQQSAAEQAPDLPFTRVGVEAARCEDERGSVRDDATELAGSARPDGDGGGRATAARPAGGAAQSGSEQSPAGKADRPTGANGASGDEARTIRVKQARVDGIIDLVGELVTARNSLLHLQSLLESGHDRADLARRMKGTSATISRAVSQLQSDVLGLRTVPLRTAFQRLPRVVHDVAGRQGKLANLRVSGEDTEVDKTVADTLVDPLIHLIRNAVDHGVETPDVRRAAGKAEEGTVWVSAEREGNSVVIEVRDDGAGIDQERIRWAAVDKGILDAGAAARLTDGEALNLIFVAGLSTASQVSDISGRGVGMDVVRTNVARVGGAVSVASETGLGTTIRLQLPLTLSVFRALMVRAGHETLALPLDAVRETVAVMPSDCKTMYGRLVANVRGSLVGLVPLAQAMGLAQATESGQAGDVDGWPVVVMQAGANLVGLVVDALDQPQEIMVKPVESYLSADGAIAGASVMGDGRVALVLDLAGIVRLALAYAQASAVAEACCSTGGEPCVR